MAQYYNFVTNASGTLTLEEVQRICSVEGQHVQVVEDVNNGGNGSQQFLAYTAAQQNNEQTIFCQQTINLGSQISTPQLEQGRPEVYDFDELLMNFMELLMLENSM
ncbi:hypothetical protein HZH68_010880 [Vespula germanica]|uniref:Uncharacterized protein n=1 Tax=Vespula germanica TaxID=30212 RepID=A0A834JUV9_VESGE|nr:hypothetical protein HZH68_010880 [Vespula germanica]